MAATGGGHYSKFYPHFAAFRHNIRRWRHPGGALLGINILSVFGNPDSIDRDVRTVKEAKVPTDETGWDRLRLMFTYDEYGEMSPELSMVVQGALMGTFTGTIIGGTIHSRDNYMRFIEKNQATAFQNHFEAKKQLQDKVTLGFARGAWMWGWRLGLFCGSFTLCTTVISVYRGKSSVLEYAAAGGITGALYKFKQGPRATIAGGIIGSALGSIAGCVSVGLMYLTGTSMEDVRYWQHKWKEEYQEKKLEALRKARSEDLDSLSRGHDQKAGSMSLENISENKSQ
ncbi:RPII140-upstream gene protein-like isoform X1 [Penaeus monodon]|uniref:RPII140-upstream gene protein-like isoform X1 n=1 Tax=Penaeus monodon TaxID=6687 RepID=UPI0018A7A858|nr:RPII140-upstream gene protein-like isoform X1 [Penaeus monodon]